VKVGDRIRFKGGYTVYIITGFSPAFIHATTEDGGTHLLVRGPHYEMVPNPT
jgi:hypothetical protein